MSTGEGNVKLRIFFVMVVSLLFIASGLWRQHLGPSAPNTSKTQVQSDDEPTEAESANLYSITCFNQCTGLGNRAWIYPYLLRFNFAFVQDFCGRIAEGYLGDPDSRATLHRVVTSHLFNLIVFRHGLGHMIYDACLRILSLGWSPEPKVSPDSLSPKITLLPRDWMFGRGFFGP